ncbi:MULTISPECIES: universal stress protein [Metallosphaera]|uniref:UspA domain protein n=3 Tax=Metallosphaera TaxID=41980 RepID=A4YI96_METS5|nr:MULTISPECIES: universal stress protein [Metallosphaera]ABP96148.1 UspA domain protein [Metallosphaera sedula DSM 5348]AIM28131.1 UspA domain protein [Metallosphaera sedula]AKV74955.1 universal stress protein UspA [Metallosphaera sedula]AKV77193.1 universal stress protein UspA [Metallosphaera sedula]AKV79443.1 universal stress protein UspA [Metallosphaera sedula]
MFKHILVAFDGSENAKRALNVAVDLSKKYEAKLDVVEVVDTSVLLGAGIGPVPPDVIESLYNKARADIESAKKIADQAGVKAEGVIVEGDPATAIMDYASKNGVDLIVTGSRGLSTIKRMFLGSVSSRIIHEAKMPVLVVK